jgi:branched-chain amino acid transport system substrate-binding protein
MRLISKSVLLFACVVSFLLWTWNCPFLAIAEKSADNTKTNEVNTSESSIKANAAFNADKMSDMSDYNPSNPVIPTGDTIRIAAVNVYSGPGAANGQTHFMALQWAAHDINKRGGIMVDGKKKLVQLIKADHMSKQDQCKKICERMVLQEKVDILMGALGSNMVKVMNEVANKYKIISWNYAGMADDLNDATNFGPYSYMVTYSTEQVGRALAYYLGQIRKKESKFYILNQDYSFGHLSADGFKDGLKEYYPGAKIVGEDYHKLYLTDFAPYLEKIKASGADAIFTADFPPDSSNIAKQAKQMGLKLPFVSFLMRDAVSMTELGVDGTKEWVHLDTFDMPNMFKNPGYVKFYKAWTEAWKKWPAPYNSGSYKIPTGLLASFCMDTYWLLSAIERAGSTHADKLAKVLEGDSYQFVTGKIVKMRPCDHKAIQDFSVTELVPPDKQNVSMTIPPYYWYKEISWAGQLYVVPAAKALPWMDQKLDRCKGKSNWGD